MQMTTPQLAKVSLSVVASLYDPLGFVAPFTLAVVQELCRRGINWDDPIPDSLRPWWEKWKKGLRQLKEVTIPRYFGEVVKVELHHFSDASNIGYGSCFYLRYKTKPAKMRFTAVW